MTSSSPPRSVFWLTAGVFLMFVFLTPVLYKPDLPPAIEINVADQPTIGYGKAKVHIVVFEEPKCHECKQFTVQIYPQLKKEYIDTHKISYTVVPVSFLPNSMPAANALLATYYQTKEFPNSELFFTYLDYIYANQPPETVNWATKATLLEYARKASEEIDLEFLGHSIEKNAYRIKIEKNTYYGKQVMGGEVYTPTVYVNGIEVKQLSYDNLKKLIEKMLEQ